MALAFVSQGEDAHFEEFAIRIMKDQFRDASEMLIEQLGESISLRRKRFLYKRKSLGKA
jgi:hypothetical protein